MWLASYMNDRKIHDIYVNGPRCTTGSFFMNDAERQKFFDERRWPHVWFRLQSRGPAVISGTHRPICSRQHKPVGSTNRAGETQRKHTNVSYTAQRGPQSVLGTYPPDTLSENGREAIRFFFIENLWLKGPEDCEASDLRRNWKKSTMRQERQ